MVNAVKMRGDKIFMLLFNSIQYIQYTTQAKSRTFFLLLNVFALL